MTGPWRDLEERLEFENEAERPLRESGEGESEGFEEAEAELIHQSEDPELGRDPELDAIVNAEAAALAAANPNTTVVHIPGAGHNIRREQFDAFMDAVSAFLVA